jgi:hypothetical protein
LEHANVGGCGQVGLEMGLVEFEESHHVANRIDTVLQFFVVKTIDVKLLVAPVDFENRLEAREEMFALREGFVN